MLAIEAAFCRVERVTLVGSIIPASYMLTNSFVAALYPISKDASFTDSAIIAPFSPALDAILFNGALKDFSTINAPT